MKIIGLHGLPRAGKDTVARIMVKKFGYVQKAFATPLKQAAAILLNRPLSQCNGDCHYDREQVMPEWGFSMREFLQKFGTECLRDQIRQDFWLERLGIELKQMRRDLNVVITDVRFQNEADFLRKLGGQIVEVWRPGLTANTHSSNLRLDPDWALYNDGTLDELISKVSNDRRL